MTGPDAVFGPPLIYGPRACDRCHATNGQRCYPHCPRYPSACACGGTGWTVTVAPDGAVTQRPCRDCLGTPGELP